MINPTPVPAARLSFKTRAGTAATGKRGLPSAALCQKPATSSALPFRREPAIKAAQGEARSRLEIEARVQLDGLAPQDR